MIPSIPFDLDIQSIQTESERLEEKRGRDEAMLPGWHCPGYERKLRWLSLQIVSVTAGDMGSIPIGSDSFFPEFTCLSGPSFHSSCFCKDLILLPGNVGQNSKLPYLFLSLSNMVATDHQLSARSWYFSKSLLIASCLLQREVWVTLILSQHCPISNLMLFWTF